MKHQIGNAEEKGVDEGHTRNMSTMSVVSNSSVEVDSDSSNDASSKDDGPAEQKFILRNELYNSLLASALGKTVLNRHLNFKEQGINFNLANLKDNLNALGALKELKDLKGLTVSSVPAFPRNLALHREDHDEVRVFFSSNSLLIVLISLVFSFFFFSYRGNDSNFGFPSFLPPPPFCFFYSRRRISQLALLFFRDFARKKDWREIEWSGKGIYSRGRESFLIEICRIV